MLRARLLALSVPVAVALAAALLPPGVAGAQAAAPEVLAVDREQVVHVSTPPGAPLQRVAAGQTPAVSPDGTRVAFAAFSTAGGVRSLDLFTTRLDGSDRRQVTSTRDDDAWPAYSPDGRTLAFLRDVPGGPRQLAVVPVEGGTARPLAAAASPPTWSPDGAFLAYGSHGLRVVGQDGRHPDVLLPGSPERGYGSPDWSPDGHRLLVSAHSGAGTSVETVEVATAATRTVLRSDPTDDLGAAEWAADGRTAYVSQGWSPGRVRRLDVETGVLDPAFAVADATSPALGGGTPDRRADSTAPGPVTGLTATTGPSRAELRYTLPAEADVAGAVVRYALGDVAPSSATEGLDGGRALLGRAVVTRLLPDTTYSFAVFARDWSGGLAPAATVRARTPSQVATTFRTSADRPLVVHGQTVVLGARLVREDTGQPVSGAPVQVLGRTAGGTDTLIATVSTDATGLARSVRRPPATTRYTLRHLGDGQLLPGSGSPLVEVGSAIGVAVRPAAVDRGARVLVEAAVRPARPGAVVTVTVLSAQGRVLDTHLVRQDRAGRVVTGVSSAVRGRHTVFVSTRDTPAARGALVSRALTVR